MIRLLRLLFRWGGLPPLSPLDAADVIVIAGQYRISTALAGAYNQPVNIAAAYNTPISIRGSL